jgi:cellulose synthase/poly-beta-1,6-N-acetylglucosamine synthase-like glycosyltransferase
MGQIDDAEFTVNRLLEKRRVGYVPSAIVYEDQPSSRKDSASRNSRMANGLNKLYWSKSMKLLGMFFKTGKATYLDLWSQLTFVQIPMLIAIVIPVYAVFYFTTLILEMCGIHLYGVLFQGENVPLIAMIALLAGGVAALLFYYFFFTLQSAIAVSKDKDVLGPDYKKNARKGIWLGAVAMFAYMGSVNSGVAKKKVAWKELKRNAPSDKK